MAANKQLKIDVGSEFRDQYGKWKVTRTFVHDGTELFDIKGEAGSKCVGRSELESFYQHVPTKTIPICEECGSSDVKCDALASWNSDAKKFEVENTFDTWQCFGGCGGEETSIEWVDAANFVEPPFKYGCPDCGEDYGDDSDSKGTVCRRCKRGIVDRKESE